MEPNVKECQLILRQLRPGAGITETRQGINSLEELYAYCVTAPDLRLVDRLVITGQDEHGRDRALTFTFQSVSERGLA